MNGKAPYAPCAGSQLVEKTPDQPAVVNHVTDCWVMLMAINARMIRTSSPAARQRTWNVRSPNGRRFVRGEADPAGVAGSAFAAMLMLRGDLAQLRGCHRVDVGRQRCVVQRCEQRLALLPEQEAEIALEQRDVGRVRLHRVHDVPRLVGDRV